MATQPDFKIKQHVGAFAEQLKRRGIAFEQGPEERYITPENGLVPALNLTKECVKNRIGETQ